MKREEFQVPVMAGRGEGGSNGGVCGGETLENKSRKVELPGICDEEGKVP